MSVGEISLKNLSVGFYIYCNSPFLMIEAKETSLTFPSKSNSIRTQNNNVLEGEVERTFHH